MRWVIVALPSELADIHLRLSKLDTAYSERVYVLAKLPDTRVMADAVMRLSADVVVDASRDARYSNSFKATLADLAPPVAYALASGLNAIINQLQPLLDERKILQTVRTQLASAVFSHNLDGWFEQWKFLGLREYGLSILKALVFERTEDTARRVRLPYNDRQQLNADAHNIVYAGFHSQGVDSKHLIVRSLGYQRFDQNEWVHKITDPTQPIVRPVGSRSNYDNYALVAIDDACWTGENAKSHVEILKEFVKEQPNITQVILRFSHATQHGIDCLDAHIKRECKANALWRVSIHEDGLIGEKTDPRPKMLLWKSESLRNDKEAYGVLDDMGWQVAGEVDTDFHWGYGGCAGTLLFQHSIPDNTLPLLWRGGRSVTINGKTVDDWIPLVFYQPD